MAKLAEKLRQLNLSEYLDALIGEGFDTWETVLDITDLDLNALNFIHSHREELQRAIAESRSHIPNTQSSNASRKRKYTRRPKSDVNAPERPPSAYVIFSNHVRQSLSSQELSFTEIAKTIGERWQSLPAGVREMYEKEANARREKYYAELDNYRKSSEYSTYQEYLANFKAKHKGQDKGKKLRTSHPDGGFSPKQLHEHGNRESKAEFSLAGMNDSTSEHDETKLGTTANISQLPGGSPQSRSRFSATHYIPESERVKFSDTKSHIHASSRATSPLERRPSDCRSTSTEEESLKRRLETGDYMGHPCSHYRGTDTLAAPPSLSYSSHYNHVAHTCLDRRIQIPTRLPSITREGIILPLEGGGREHRADHVGSFLPVVNNLEFP